MVATANFRRWPIGWGWWVVFCAGPVLAFGTYSVGPFLAVIDDFGDLVLVNDDSHTVNLEAGE